MSGNTDVNVLRALAELDARKRELEAAMASLPAARAKREAALEALRAEFRKVQGEYDAMLRERRSLDALLQDKNQTLARYRTQLDTVKTNKEYQSMQAEIERTREEIHAAEDRVLELMEEIDAAAPRVTEKRAAVEMFEKEDAAYQAEEDRRIREIETQLVEVEEKRKKLLPELTPTARSEYLRVFDHYHGDAFAVVADGVCQGCFVNIPSQIIGQIQTGTIIFRCESCGRFIVDVVFERER